MQTQTPMRCTDRADQEIRRIARCDSFGKRAAADPALLSQIQRLPVDSRLQRAAAVAAGPVPVRPSAWGAGFTEEGPRHRPRLPGSQ